MVTEVGSRLISISLNILNLIYNILYTMKIVYQMCYTLVNTVTHTLYTCEDCVSDVLYTVTGEHCYTFIIHW